MVVIKNTNNGNNNNNNNKSIRRRIAKTRSTKRKIRLCFFIPFLWVYFWHCDENDALCQKRQQWDDKTLLLIQLEPMKNIRSSISSNFYHNNNSSEAAVVQHNSVYLPTTTEQPPQPQPNHDHRSTNPTNNNNPKKFIVFRKIRDGKRLGNIMSGLLAVHLLGIEFDRIVCVSPTFREFHRVFEPIHPMAVRYCPDELSRQQETATTGRLQRNQSIVLISYKNGKVANECNLRDLLQSDVKTWFITTNVYPRWPIVPGNFFFANYKAKPELLNVLPYNHLSPPEIVVHLRQEDGAHDRRGGLDNATLRGLGRLLPQNKSTFLVTNNVLWYEDMEQRFGWDHPHWSSVRHPALKNIQWGVGVPAAPRRSLRKNQTNDDHWEKQQQDLQLFSDWYTVLTAKRVYHTHSEFSESAIRWMGARIDPKIIRGYNSTTGTVILRDEPRLVDRTEHELQHCT